MYKQYLYLFLIIILLSQPEILHLLNANILGRLLLIGSVVFCTLINSTMGFIYIFLIIGILSTSTSSKENMTSNGDAKKSGDKNNTGDKKNTGDKENTDDKENSEDQENTGDREKTETLLKPKSSNDIPTITPLTIYEPEPSDVDMVENFAPF